MWFSSICNSRGKVKIRRSLACRVQFLVAKSKPAGNQESAGTEKRNSKIWYETVCLQKDCRYQAGSQSMQYLPCLLGCLNQIMRVISIEKMKNGDGSLPVYGPPNQVALMLEPSGLDLLIKIFISYPSTQSSFTRSVFQQTQGVMAAEARTTFELGQRTKWSSLDHPALKGSIFECQSAKT